MPFCPQCGSQVEGRFCARCGATVGAEAPPPPPPQQPQYQQQQPYQYQQQYQQPQPGAAASGMGDNVASALCYLLGVITGVIFLVLAPYNQNKAVRFHAFQSIFMNLAIIVIAIGLAIVSTVMFTISFWLGSLFGLVQLLFSLGIFVLWIFMMFKSYNNQKVVLPVVGPLAEKQA